MMDKEKILAAAESCRADMSAFLRAMISHPSESCEEKEVVACIKAEMEKLGYDEGEVDGLGNAIGWMGEGDTDPDKYRKVVWGGEYPTV